jgi:hypothetical protein
MLFLAFLVDETCCFRWHPRIFLFGVSPGAFVLGFGCFDFALEFLDLILVDEHLVRVTLLLA